MLIMSCPRVLFESKLCITCSISFSVNVIFDKDVVKRELHYRPLSMIEHCLAKKEWNNSFFSLKFVTNLFSWKISGIQGIFYYYGKTLLLTNTFWDLQMVPLTFQINENNISPLTLQWNHLNGTTLRLNLANTVWWWKVWCKENWTPDSATKFGWEAKTESLQKDLSPII